jgi:hypothetical protein
MKKLFYGFLLILALLLCTWAWAATQSKHAIYFEVPDSLQAVAAHVYGSAKDEQSCFMPDPETVVLINYSVMIHKSQIHPWGTLWRRSSTVRLVNHKWIYASVTSYPNF